MNSKTIIFIFLAALYSFSTFYEPYAFSYLVKILPLMVLIFIAVQNVSNLSDKLFLLGLICSVTGDFILDYAPSEGFIYGLGAFLIAHLLYIFSFAPVEPKRYIIALCYVIFGVSMFLVIQPGLGKLFLPVFVYMNVLLIMGIFTLISKKSNVWLMLGGLSFVVSDSLLGINKFAIVIPFAHLLIMITYYFAQFSLVKGFVNKRLI